MRRRATPSRLVEARATLRTHDDGSMRIVVVADTHSHPHPRSGEHIRALRPDAILHAGDIGDLAVLDELREIAPLLAVRGNIDAHAPGLPDAVTIDVEREASGDARVVLRLVMLHIAVYGPKLRAEAAKLARERGASLVVCGHSHVPFIGRDRGIDVLNAGSIGPRRFQLPIVFGVVDLSPSRLDLRHVDCETGERWEPPG
jgi:putative phosphoesterase